ncbi:MAG TPA: hypothetical protein QF873_03750 [Patescibacteria group bacterium]|nr:hypothetical protein [Patescibacteria group bacterium]
MARTTFSRGPDPENRAAKTIPGEVLGLGMPHDTPVAATNHHLSLPRGLADLAGQLRRARSEPDSTARDAASGAGGEVVVHRFLPCSVVGT